MAYFNAMEQENAILEIQRILRDLDRYESGLARVRLTGAYDDETRQGVKDFQRKYDLPETGIVDHTTWQVMAAVGKAQKEATLLARAIYLLPRSEEYSIAPNLQDDVIYVIQYLLNVVSQEYDEIEPLEYTGIYDIPTQEAVKEFQRKSLLEADGIITPTTFNRLAAEYERINSYNQ